MTHERTHALYRFYDATGTLLYIGITADPGNRWRSHAQDKPWWQQVTNITVETHPTRTAVLDAERAAIIAEKPTHNIVHNRRRSSRSLPSTPYQDPWVTEWARQAQDMPDDCHDICVRDGIEAIYFPHLWHDGTAHYTCEHGHHWTCSWGHNKTGAAPENRGHAHQILNGAAS